MPSLGEEEGGRETGFVRRQHPSLSLSFSPPLIRVRFFRWQSLENRDSLFLSPPLSLSLRFHAFPAGSELLFAREPRCRPLCLASVCILIVGPPLSFVPRVARREEGEEREREREGRVVNPREIPFKAAFQRSW